MNLFKNTVTGYVFDQDERPIQGVNVRTMDNSSSTQTNDDGFFAIPVNSGENLVFSHVGYASKTVNSNEVNLVNLEFTSVMLDEVVIGTSPGSNSTGKSNNLIWLVLGSAAAVYFGSKLFGKKQPLKVRV